MKYKGKYSCILLCNCCNKEFEYYYNYTDDIKRVFKENCIEKICCCFCDNIFERAAKEQEVKTDRASFFPFGPLAKESALARYNAGEAIYTFVFSDLYNKTE